MTKEEYMYQYYILYNGEQVWIQLPISELKYIIDTLVNQDNIIIFILTLLSSIEKAPFKDESW